MQTPAAGVDSVEPPRAEDAAVLLRDRWKLKHSLRSYWLHDALNGLH